MEKLILVRHKCDLIFMDLTDGFSRTRLYFKALLDTHKLSKMTEPKRQRNP